MVVTALGKVICVRPEHPENARFSMAVTVSGRVICAKLEQFMNAAIPMAGTLSDRDTVTGFLLAFIACPGYPSRTGPLTVKVRTALQPENASSGYFA